MSKSKTDAPAAVKAPAVPPVAAPAPVVPAGESPPVAVTVAAELIPPVIDSRPPPALPLDKAGAGAAVFREKPVIGEDGKPTGETEAVPVAEDEVLAFAVRGDVVTVVTTDGQKLVGSL